MSARFLTASDVNHFKTIEERRPRQQFWKHAIVPR